ncbi:hypothetical protein YB2330_001345 [Saitoella coloradoensis]
MANGTASGTHTPSAPTSSTSAQEGVITPVTQTSTGEGVPVPSTATQPNATDHFLSFLYHSFLTASFTDTTLYLSSLPKPYHLHSLFASRSPLLLHLLSQQPAPPYHIHFPVADRNLTQETVGFALSTLYTPTAEARGIPDGLDPRGVLAAAALLGLPGLAAEAYNALTATVNAESLPELLRFALDGSQPAPGTPSSTSSGPSSGAETDVLAYAGPYPPYTTPLLPLLLETMTKLPTTTLQTLLPTLPFAIVKKVLESPALTVGGEMARYNFAKDVVARRKPVVAQEGGAWEESVVLAFGGGSGGVEVVRRQKGRGKAFTRYGPR